MVDTVTSFSFPVENETKYYTFHFAEMEVEMNCLYYSLPGQWGQLYTEMWVIDHVTVLASLISLQLLLVAT